MRGQKSYESNLKAIKDIGTKDLGNKIKANSEKNMKGALIGGGVGVVLGLASRTNPLIFGFVGLILGRLFLSR